MSVPVKPFPSALRAAASLAAALAAALVAARVLKSLGATPGPAWAWALATGTAAALIGRAWRLEPWWRAILAAFPAALLVMARMEIPPQAWALLLLALLLVYGATFRTRVPLYLSGPKARSALLARLPPPGSACRCIDLGSGLGGLALALARARPDGEFAGVELAPLPALGGWLRARLARLPNLRLAHASLWEQPLAGYDVVYAFLSPVPMAALWDKARREMRPGTLFISNTFAVPGVEPDEVIPVDDARGTRLLVWRMGGR